MSKHIFLLCSFLFLLVTTTHAETLNIFGNGANSQNSISVEQEDTQTIKQNNSMTITNTIDANASTGENTVSNNSGNAIIKTGDANVNVSSTNVGNINGTQTNCPSRTPTTKPTSTPKPQPTTQQPTATPGSNSGSTTNDPGTTNSSSTPSQGGVGGAPIGGGDILGLAATSGNNVEYVATILGTLCLTIGSLFLTVKKHGV